MAQKLLMGNEAFAHAALEAGVRVVAGYPGTPSSELIETVAKLHREGKAQGVYVEWSTNEKAALEVLAGAAYSGARVLFTCKQVGMNVATDPLMSLNYVGVRGGCVLFVADDPGPISSQTEQDTRRFAAFAKVPVLDPATPDQGFAMMKAAFELSERYGTPVIVRPTTRICHASTYFDVQEETVARDIPEGGFEKDPKWVIFPKRSFEAHGEINNRLRAIAQDFSHDSLFSEFNEVYEGGTGDKPELGIVAGGVSAAYALEALSLLGVWADEAGIPLPAYKFIQVGTPYPFPEETMMEFARDLKKIIVFEELDSFLEEELLKFGGTIHGGFRVLGKLNGYAQDRGENTAEDIALRLVKFFDPKAQNPLKTLVESKLDPQTRLKYDDDLPIRPPVLCAGCPHRGSFYAVKRALGKREAILCGDIGCYTLGNAKPLDAVDTCLCMGAGITMAQGFSIVEPEKKHLAFVGDSTFFASGITGVVEAVYNQHDFTLVVLDNATTAMTGSQPHPGTGVTLMGPHSVPIDIAAVLEAIGVKCIVHANPLKLEESIEAAKKAIDYPGPSAILYQSPCIQLIKPGPPVFIDPDICTGCKRCITEIGCPGLGFDPEAQGPRSDNRGQAYVDASLCNGCGLCVQICPFEAIIPSSRDASAADSPDHSSEVNEKGKIGSPEKGAQACAIPSSIPSEGKEDSHA